jgi:hypothetical protein
MLPDLQELLRKYKEKTYTLEELARLRSYFSARNHESLVKKSLYQEIVNFVPSLQTESGPDFKRIFENIQSNITESSPAELETQFVESAGPSICNPEIAATYPVFSARAMLAIYFGKQAETRKYYLH